MVFSILNTTLSYFQPIALPVSGKQGLELTNLPLVLWISDSVHNCRGPTLKHKVDIIKLNHWNLKIGKLEVEQALISRNWESKALATAEAQRSLSEQWPTEHWFQKPSKSPSVLNLFSQVHLPSIGLQSREISQYRFGIWLFGIILSSMSLGNISSVCQGEITPR